MRFLLFTQLDSKRKEMIQDMVEHSEQSGFIVFFAVEKRYMFLRMAQ